MTSNGPILIAYDGSDDARHAIEHAAEGAEYANEAGLSAEPRIASAAEPPRTRSSAWPTSSMRR